MSGNGDPHPATQLPQTPNIHSNRTHCPLLQPPVLKLYILPPDYSLFLQWGGQQEEGKESTDTREQDREPVRLFFKIGVVQNALMWGRRVL
jgi:hypothetical protein